MRSAGLAALVSIDVYEDGGALVTMVEDDGKGFDVASTLRLLGAQLTLDSSPGQGTRVHLRIPFG